MDLSIIVPVYNGGKYLKKCINNILEQTYKDFELIIINDGSTDDTKAICDSLANIDDRVKFIHKKNEGVSIARNTGLEVAKGKYIGFVDCDDSIDKNMYKVMIENMQKQDTDCVMCSFMSVFDDREEKNLFEDAEKKIEKNKFKEDLTLKMISPINEDGSSNNIIMGSIWRCLFKKEILDKNNLIFDKELKYSEDLIFVLEYLEVCKSIYITNDIFYFYNRKSEAGSTTQKHIVGLEDNIDKVNKIILEMLNLKNIKDTKIWALREITYIYTLAVNIALQKEKSFAQKITELKQMVKRRQFNYYIKKLNSNEYYGLNKLVILSLKYRLYFLVIKYYSK